MSLTLTFWLFKLPSTILMSSLTVIATGNSGMPRSSSSSRVPSDLLTGENSLHLAHITDSNGGSSPLSLQGLSHASQPSTSSRMLPASGTSTQSDSSTPQTSMVNSNSNNSGRRLVGAKQLVEILPSPIRVGSSAFCSSYNYHGRKYYLNIYTDPESDVARSSGLAKFEKNLNFFRYGFVDDSLLYISPYDDVESTVPRGHFLNGSGLKYVPRRLVVHVKYIPQLKKYFFKLDHTRKPTTLGIGEFFNIRGIISEDVKDVFDVYNRQILPPEDYFFYIRRVSSVPLLFMLNRNTEYRSNMYIRVRIILEPLTCCDCERSQFAPPEYTGDRNANENPFFPPGEDPNIIKQTRGGNFPNYNEAIRRRTVKAAEAGAPSYDELERMGAFRHSSEKQNIKVTQDDETVSLRDPLSPPDYSEIANLPTT